MGLLYAKLGVAGVLLLVSLAFLASPDTFRKAPLPLALVWIVWGLPLFRFVIPIVCCVTLYRGILELRAGDGRGPRAP